MVKLTIQLAVWIPLTFVFWTSALHSSGANGHDDPTIDCYTTSPILQLHWNQSFEIDEPVFNCTVSIGSDLIITNGNTDNMLYTHTVDTLGFVFFSRTPTYEQYNRFTISVAAQEEGTQTIWPGQVIIFIDDSDTHYPTFFPLSVQVPIKENIWDNDFANFMVTDGDGSDDFGINSVTFSFKPPTGDYGGTFNLSSTLMPTSATYANVSVGLQEQLDYETTVFYFVILVSMDGGGLYTEANVIVNVIDQEDTPPQFTKIAPYTEIPENTPINTIVFQVTAIDGDRGINHPVRYAFQSGNEDDDFFIDEVTGIVYVQHELDADSKTRTSLYTLNINATEQDVVDESAPYVSNTICIVSVTDVDDNPPLFSYAAYNASIDELSPIGTEATFRSGHSIVVTDADMGENAAFTVALTDETGIFSIEPLHGEKQETFSIVVNDPTLLNCDILQFVSMTVLVTDNLMPTFTNEATIHVTVNDVNNHWPEFSINNYTMEIDETAVEGTAVLTVTAIDRDIDERYNKVYYRMESGASAFSIFMFNGTITVATGVTLDRDVIPSYSLTVSADDGTVHSDASNDDTCSVQIVLLDVDNKPPRFSADGGKFVTAIDENTVNEGNPIIRADATDPDLNCLLEYAINYTESAAYDNRDAPIVGWNLSNIVINEGNGDIVLNEPFDREQTKTIVLALIVTDVNTVVGVDHATGQLTININDVNDNAPIFDEVDPCGSIKENMANALISYPNGTGILRIHATDADAVYNVVSLKVISNDREPYTVAVDTDSGYLTVGQMAFDYEKFHSVNLVVEASDNGLDPQFTANVSVNISVVDQNDNSPQFQNLSYTFYLPENSYTFSNGSAVFADDADSGVYGQVTYLVRDPAFLNFFNISDTQGEIVVTRPLDYETIQLMEGTVFAYDNFYSKDGSPINSDKTQAIIEIIDENDNWPQFLNQNDVITTPEDTNLHTPVGTVKAVDKDRSPKYHTLVFKPLTDNLFKIDQNSGQLTVASSLVDRVGSHSISVKVCDTGEPPNGPNCNETTYTIDITDINNHPPVIDYPQQNADTTLKEGTYIDVVVLFVNITDADTDIENKESKFNMTAKCFLGPTAGNDAEEFYIEPYSVSELSAEVHFSGNLTRELCYVYQLFLMATNVNNPAMQSSLRTCFVDVQSMYHHPPQFPPGTVFKMDFTEEQPPGSPVFLPAQPYNPDDEGTGNASAVFCYILGGPYADDFVVTDHTYCNFTTAKKLDREAIPSFNDMQVILVATEYDVQPARIDHYDKTNASQLLAHVRLLDINDNPPHFNESQFFGGVSSDTVKGTNFMNLTAYDVDTIDEGKLRYSIIGTPIFHENGNKGGVSMNPFTLDAVTGFINLVYTFGDDQRGYVDFVVQVVDSDVTHVDRANVSVYVVSKSDKLICLAELSPDVFIADFSETFADDFTIAIEKRVVLDVVQIHVDETGAKLDTLSDVYIHLVDASTNNVIDAHSASNIIDANVEALTPVYTKYHIVRVNGPVTNEPIVDTKFYIVTAIAVALAVFLAATVSVCLYKGFKLKLKLKAATAEAFTGPDQHSEINQICVPNTNKHSVKGSNPVWNDSTDYAPQDSHNFSVPSDASDNNSLVDVEERNEFHGGVNNPTFEQRIENVFKIAGSCGSSNNIDDYDDDNVDEDNISGLYDTSDSHNPEYNYDTTNDGFILGAKII